MVEEIKETRIKSQETRPRTEEDEIEDEILEEKSLVRQELEHRKNAKRKPFYTRPSSSKSAQRGFGNDLTAMFEALNKLELAVIKSVTCP